MDEDIEFREMMLKNLETNGFLQEIRAKLRAQIYFSAYENNQLTSTNDHIGNAIPLIDTNAPIDTESQRIGTQEPGKSIKPADYESLALGLVEDLLDSLNLCHTKSVFKSELSSLSKIQSSTHIEKLLDLDRQKNNSNGQENDSSTDENINNCNSSPNIKKSPLLIKLLEKYIQQNHIKQQEIDSLNSSSDNTEEKSYNSSGSVVVNNDTFISSKTATSTVSNQLSESL